MKRLWLHAAVAAIAMAFGTAAQAQGRHDEKHGKPGKPAAAPDTPASDRMPGRHDERPHGPPKKKAQKKADAKKAEAKQDSAK